MPQKHSLQTQASIVCASLAIFIPTCGELDLAQSLIHEERLSRELGCPIDRKLRLRTREECPVPSLIDFRMAEEQI